MKTVPVNFNWLSLISEFFPEILETCCAECSEKLIGEVKRMADFLYEHKPEYGKKTLDRFDPDGKYRAKCDETLKSKGVDLTRFWTIEFSVMKW